MVAAAIATTVLGVIVVLLRGALRSKRTATIF
jgi:hypothetical protein